MRMMYLCHPHLTKLREVKEFVQGHTGSKQGSPQNQALAFLASKSLLSWILSWMSCFNATTLTAKLFITSNDNMKEQGGHRPQCQVQIPSPTMAVQQNEQT